ncbi:hypothetical protein QYE76_003126 [Lolium multiflorum]|uniref:Transposase (putative) gypsy type domain-containing protein n=1 Tax=Lolium multiflorum TaxID=4521 RepID=A0AAD8RS00_LOLMU|nr:hypothetical protein QYE76_003126 [Lolium multiflorum]
MRSTNLFPAAYKYPPFTPFTPFALLFTSHTASPPSSSSAALESTGVSSESSRRREVFFVFLSPASHRSENSPSATSTTAEAIPMSSSTPPPSTEPIAATPISSAPPLFIPVQLEPSRDSGKSIEGASANPEDIAGAKQMEKKAEEAAAKKSKARKRDDTAKGKWWHCFTSEIELRNLEAEGFIKPGSWRRVSSELNPAPEAGEWVVTKALIERGFSLPPSDFFSEILKTYELQPHHIAPNSILAISNHVALCEGHLRIAPDLPLF